MLRGHHAIIPRSLHVALTLTGLRTRGAIDRLTIGRLLFHLSSTFLIFTRPSIPRALFLPLFDPSFLLSFILFIMVFFSSSSSSSFGRGQRAGWGKGEGGGEVLEVELKGGVFESICRRHRCFMKKMCRGGWRELRTNFIVNQRVKTAGLLLCAHTHTHIYLFFRFFPSFYAFFFYLCVPSRFVFCCC